MDHPAFRLHQRTHTPHVPCSRVFRRQEQAFAYADGLAASLAPEDAGRYKLLSFETNSTGSRFVPPPHTHTAAATDTNTKLHHAGRSPSQNM